MTQNPFEFPEQLRELAEKNVEQASAAYSQFMNSMTEAMGMWSQAIPSNEVTDGFKPVQETAIRFANQNADAALAMAKELANAKDMQEVISIQTRFAQSQMQTYAIQSQELGQLMIKASQKMQSRG